MSRSSKRGLIVSLIALSGCAATNDPSPLGYPAHQTVHTAIDAHLREMVTEEHFTGVALVMQSGQTIHARGYGPATGDHVNDVHTAFHIASISKQFTAAAVLQLVEIGAVALHTSINNYLPKAYRSERWSSVTVHHLLCHSSGVPDYATSRHYYDISDGFASQETVDGMIVEAMGKDLEFAPGSQYAYSNLGYTLLGKAIEHISNVSFADYIEQKILEPMAMISSRIRPYIYTPTADEAAGFRWSEDRAAFIQDESETLPATPPDAGLITTLGDFAKWSQIYLGGDQEILSQDSISAMTTPHIQMGRGGSVDAYGYGLGVGDRLLAHSGHVIGFRSQFILDRQTNTVIAVFSNNSAVNMERIAFGVLTVLFAPEPSDSTLHSRRSIDLR